MDMALVTRLMSKDPSTKVGAVLVRDRRIISTGFNGFPRHIPDDQEKLNKRTLKSNRICHAEANAITGCALHGISSYGATLYVTLHPCHECMKLVIQSGINRIVCPALTSQQLVRWGDSAKLAAEFADTAGIEICQI